MRLEWIEDILAVSQTGSFSAAAQQRFLTPSAFTRRIRTIEESLGCTLFDRSRKPIRLEQHVQDSLPELIDAVQTLKSLKKRLSEPDMSARQQITLICQHALTGTVAPQLIAHPNAYKKISARIKSGSMNECLLELVNRASQFALIYQPMGGISEDNMNIYDQLLLGQEVFLPVAVPGIFVKPQDPKGVYEFPIIKYPPNIFLGEIQRRRLQEEARPNQRLITVAETGLSLAVVEFVRRGIGVGWLPLSIIKQDLKTGVLVSLKDHLPDFDLDVTLMRLKTTLPGLAEEFWNSQHSRADLPRQSP